MSTTDITHCRKGKFPTYHKLTCHTTKSTRYSQLQSTTYCCYVLLSLLRNQQKFAKCRARTNHTFARVNNDTSSPARVSNDIGDLAHVSDDIGGPIKLWHVSPIGLRHVSLTHSQTPINRSLPKAFERKRGFRNTKALQESSLKAFKNFNPKIEEHSKHNHPNYLPRS